VEAALIRESQPGDRARQSPVQLEDARAVAEPLEASTICPGQCLTADLDDRPGAGVEDVGPGWRELGEAAHRLVQNQLSPQTSQQRDQGPRDRRRSTFGHGPGGGVAGDQKDDPKGRGERILQRLNAVGGAADEEGSGFCSIECIAGQTHRRTPGRKAKTAEDEGVTRPTQRSQGVVQKFIDVPEEWLHHPAVGRAIAPQLGGGLLHRRPQDHGGPIIERVGHGCGRGHPTKAVVLEPQAAKEGRQHPQGVGRRTDVVAKAWQGQLGGAGAPSGLGGGLDHPNPQASLQKVNGGSQAVGPRADHHHV
jgi:hypothetical protein